MGIDDKIPTPKEWIHLAHIALHEKEPNRAEWRTLVSNGMWVVRALSEECIRLTGSNKAYRESVDEFLKAMKDK